MAKKRKKVWGLVAVSLVLAFFIFQNSPHSKKTQPSTRPAFVIIPTSPAPKFTAAARSTPVELSRHLPMTVTPPRNLVAPVETLDVRQARREAKRILSDAYAALKAAHEEFGRYSTDFHFVGFTPFEEQESAVIEYKTGFIKPFDDVELIETKHSSENPESMSTDTFMNIPINVTNSDRNAILYSESAKTVLLGNYAKYCKNGCTATEDSFEMLLVRPLKGHGKDVWIINEKKELILACDGLLTEC